MTPSEPGAADDDLVSRAAQQLAQRASSRWVEVSSDVLSVVMSSSRSSSPVLVHTADDGSTISLGEQVVVARLRAVIDDALPDAAVSRIHLEVSRDRRLRHVTVELVVEYGASLIDVADHVRALIVTELRTWLDTEDADVRVRPAHVHFGDVVRTDPHFDNPVD